MVRRDSALRNDVACDKHVLLKKAVIIDKILAELASELEGYLRSARSAHAEATDEQSKAENKYDTRGLEASYLAHGQSRQALEITEAIEQYRALEPRDFGPAEPVDIGAVVAVESKRETAHYFMGPRAGGTEVVVDSVAVTVITPPSPLGQQLAGKKTGDTWSMKIGGRAEKYRITRIL